EPEATAARPRLRYLALAAGLVVITATAVLIGARFLPHGSAPAAAPGRTGTAGCPATRRVAAARCPASPECFGGLVVSAGSASAEPVACNRSHYWETFAIAILPAEVRTFDQDAVGADPAVRTVCS